MIKFFKQFQEPSFEERKARYEADDAEYPTLSERDKRIHRLSRERESKMHQELLAGGNAGLTPKAAAKYRKRLLAGDKYW